MLWRDPNGDENNEYFIRSLYFDTWFNDALIDKLDGVKNRWQELWYVTLPSMKPQLMFGAVMQITQSFAVADISIQLAGNPSVNYAGATVVTHLLDYGSTRFDMGYASAIATVLFLLMVGTNKLVQKILGRVGE